MVTSHKIEKFDLKPFMRYMLFYSIAIILLIFSNSALQAQTRNYLKGDITGGRANIGALGFGTSAGVSAPVNTFNTYPLFVETFQFYYGRNILNDTSTLYTTMTAARLNVLLGLSGGDVYIQFRNTGNVAMPAGKSVFFKLGNAVTSSGLSVSVGGLLSLGNNSPIIGTMYTGAGNYLLTGSGRDSIGSIPAGNTFNTEFLQDKNGIVYAGVHPQNKTQTYNSARLMLRIPSGLLDVDLNTVSMNVHNAFYLSAGGACSTTPMFTTQGEIEGLELDLDLESVDLNELVANPKNAIDSNSSTYSVLKTGVAGLGILSSVSQSFLFDHVANSGDGLRLQLSVDTNLLSLSLLNGVSVEFYNGDTLKSTKQLGNNLLSLDLLTLPLLGSSYRQINTVFIPGMPFDRAKVKLNGGLLSLELLGSGLYIHEVSLAPAVPVITASPSNDTVCNGEPASFIATTTGAAGYSWEYYNTGTSSWVTAGSATATLNIPATTMAMDNRQYRIKVTGSGSCPQTVTSHVALLKVKPRPVAPSVLFGP